MKFRATPNLYVKIATKYIQRVTGRKGFCFDDKGEYETENKVLITALSQYFEVVKEENIAIEEVKEKNQAVEEPKGEEIKLKHCKKCDFTCDNQGVLLQHYREQHPRNNVIS